MIVKLMASWSYLTHQIEWSEKLYKKIQDYGLAILASEERTGKTGTFIKVAELSKASRILILTKKAAIGGIQEHIDNLGATKDYTVINYQSVHKVEGEFDFIILDEFHQALCSYPKPSDTFKTVSKLTKEKPILYVSATPFSESYSQSYHALKLSSWTPFKHKRFYDWHRAYGIEDSIWMNGRQVKQYHGTQEAVIKSILSKYILKATRQEIGFKHEPTDHLHYVELNAQTVADIKMYQKAKMKHFCAEPIPLDSAMAEMNAVYLRGGGIVEHNKDCYQLSSEKLDYFLEHFGDYEDVAVMAHYVCEQKLLDSELKNATVLSSTAHAEGVDLHKFKHLVIYSLGFSTSKHVQRRARQCNINREVPIDVHFLLTDNGLDKHVYECVDTKKTNFTARIYNDRAAITE